MEHLIDMCIFSQKTGITNNDKALMLIEYAKAIYTENKKYNLTGHKTLPEIIENLIIESLKPVKNIIVPRGTLFADIGTGSGIPGIPLAIKYDDIRGILFDSNQKKVRFINKTASNLMIRNVKCVDIRVEDACRMKEYRETFDMVFTRAMSDIYTIAELGAPLLKIGGFIFLYANKNQADFNDYLLSHLSDLGLSSEISSSSEYMINVDMPDVILLTKINETDTKYPRRMPAITRMATRLS